VRQGNATGNLVFDAQIVAVCREWGVSTLITEDRDFTRFEGLAIRGLAPATSR
jgi:predicted nucleic acid-binding protein